MFYLYGFSLLFGGLAVMNLIFSYQSKHIDSHFWPTLKFQLLALPLFLIANLCIGYGVKFGAKAAGQLSFALIAGKCMEVAISLAMGYLFMKEVPNGKTWLGIGIIVAGVLLIKQK